VKDAVLDQQTTYGNRIGAVNLQQMDRCAPGRCLSEKSSAIPGEMLVPWVPSRMKQGDNLTGIRVDARQIRPFVTVAIAARESEVFQNGGTSVLLSDHVVEVKRQFSERFRESAILAAVTGPGADGLVNRFVHWRASAGSRATQRQARLRFQKLQSPTDIEVVFQLPFLSAAQFSAVGLAGKLAHAFYISF
jgi:hypothetical protein